MTPVSWSFQTSAPPPPGLEDGPGGPIAVVTSTGNPSSSYLSEILRAEGLNEFANLRVSTLNAATLAPYAVVVLGDVAITDAQVAALTDWVERRRQPGRDATRQPPLRPRRDHRARRAPSPTATSRSTRPCEPGAGITTDTMQFHGTANRYSLNGATSVADALLHAPPPAPGCPAVTLRSVGTNGGQVADLRVRPRPLGDRHPQGNLAWAGPGPRRRDAEPLQRPVLRRQRRPTGSTWPRRTSRRPTSSSGCSPTSSTVTDPRPVPAAAVLVLPGHATRPSSWPPATTTPPAARPAASAPTPPPSPSGCSVARWECPRFTSYVYPSTPMTNAQAATFDAQGFEVGLHPSNGCTQLHVATRRSWTPTPTQLGAWRAKYTSRALARRPAASTASSGATGSPRPRPSSPSGIRLDTNYYYYPGSLDRRPARAS